MLPQLAAGVPAFQRTEPIPLGPLAAHDVFGINHGLTMLESAPALKRGFQPISLANSTDCPRARLRRSPRREQLELLKAAEKVGGEEGHG